MTKIVKKVLLVDDDKVTNLLHTRLINRTGLVETVDVVTDGIAALEYLNEMHSTNGVQPELIFLDINMPRMNGFEFLQAYADLPEIPRDQQIVVMLSTSLLQSDHDRAEADPNVYKFANKPINPDQIREFVHECHARATLG